MSLNSKNTNNPSPRNTGSCEELSFVVKGLHIRAKRWNRGARLKALALHGWLDNCNSFETLAPSLSEIDFIAIDCAGHGQSNFRSEDSEYLIWPEVGEVFSIADQLDWDCFNLIGHSRGANIASICAGTFPERITKLVLIEGGIPIPHTEGSTAENLAQHIRKSARLNGTKGTLFDSEKAAIEARANGLFPVSVATAKRLAARSLVQDGEEFRWRADPRLKAPSSIKLSQTQIGDFFNRICSPVLLIEATDGIIKKMPYAEEHLANISALQRIEFPGGHHLHMEGAAENCVWSIKDFLY